MILTATSDSTRLVEYEWTINGVIEAQSTKSIDVDVKSPDVVSVKGKNDCGNWSQPVTLDWGVIPPSDGYIGDITYEIREDLLGDDEIKFTIPIVNKSSEEMCFYVDLRDASGVFLEKAPMLLQTLKLSAGGSGNIIVDSYGAINPSWGLSNVLNTLVKFELKSIKTILGICSPPPVGYEVIEAKTLNVTTADEEPDEKPVMPDDDAIMPEENLRIVSADYPAEVGYNDIFTMKFTVDNINTLLSVNAIAQLFDKSSGSFITERRFKVKPGENYILELPGYMYTTNHLNYKLVILQDRVWPLSNEIEDILNFTVLNRDYVDPDDPTIVWCTQEFKILYDEVAVPGTVVVAGGEVPVSVEGGSITLIKGKEYIATAYHKLGNETKIFTSCTLEPIVFGLKSEPEPKPEFDTNLILYLAVFIAAVMMFKGA